MAAVWAEAAVRLAGVVVWAEAAVGSPGAVAGLLEVEWAAEGVQRSL